MNFHDVFENRYYITGNIVLKTPLHIGKGTSLEPTGTDLPVLKTPTGEPYIPGSSLKGVLRFETEKILRTLAAQNLEINGKKLWACNILEDKERCIPLSDDSLRKKTFEDLEKEAKNNGVVDEEELTKKIIENSCTACRIFGSPVMASRIYIKDAFLVGNTVKTEIRDGIAVDRDTGTVKEGAKFDYEVVPAGTVFTLNILLENVEEWEVGLISLILNMWSKEQMLIGGKNSSGLGWSKIENVQVEKVDNSNLIEFLSSGTKYKVEFNNLITAFTSNFKGGEK